MNAGELFKAGKLQEAIDAQIQEVKKNAADPNKRVFLYELAAFAGGLHRHAARIDHLHIPGGINLIQAMRAQQGRDLVAFVLIDFTAERVDRESFHGRHNIQAAAGRSINRVAEDEILRGIISRAEPTFDF